jgi:peptidoglycan/xylan/chitin deacetylase (PgdA/CDA1 family)
MSTPSVRDGSDRRGAALRATRLTRWRIALLVATVCLLVGVVGPAGAKTTAAQTTNTTAQTIVSLTFDDGRATQYVARPILAAHAMDATFYVNSPRLGSSSFYLSWQQVQDLATDGNEIGGHTAYHANLPQVDPIEAKRQICYDRVNLLNHGLQATDFAYPYGAYNASVESMVQACGYNSARTTDPFGSAFAETTPPQDLYAIRSKDGAGSNALSSLEAAVTSAEQHGGGWVPLVFHDICNGCSSVATTQGDFSALLDWLQQQAANGVVVRTVQQAIGGTVQPAVPGPALPAPPNGTNAVKNASLELDTNTDRAPDCFDFDDFGSNTFTWTRTTDAHTGTYAERVDVSNYSTGDHKLTPQQDLGYCSPSVTPGHRYRITAWYKSTVPVSFTVFARNSQWAFPFWTGSPDLPATSGWAQASWVTPVIPSDVNGVSFGLAVDSNGSLTVDDLSFDDAAPTGGADSTAPTVSLTAPTGGANVSGIVALSAAASDNIAIDHVDFLVDGSLVGSSVIGPFGYGWNSRSVANGNHTITVRAVDTSGNTKTTSAITVFVSNQATNLLQNPSLETASGTTPTCWLLGGYGTNTFSWTRTSDAHTGSFGEALAISSYTSGDRKLVNTQDSGACAPAATVGHTYTVTAWYKSTSGPPYIFAYYRNSSGAWVYWAQSARLANSSSWTQASWGTPPVPSGATNLSVGMGISGAGSITMDDFALLDNAPPPDTTPPTSTISCNADASGDSEGDCSTGYYNGPVHIQLNATDDPGGSGVASIRYTTNGSDPTATNGTVYGGPFDTTTTVKYRAFDNAGNAEAIHTQPILIDPTPPTTSITCNGSACASGYYNTAVSVNLTASDAGGSGVRAIYYTTDGSDPSQQNGSVVVGAFSVPSTATVKYLAYDNAGNAEAIHTQLIQIDTVAPSSTISCNGSPCGSSSYSTGVNVSLAAVDSGGSGVASIRYTTDGTDPTSTNGSVYLSQFLVDTTTTVEYRAFDNAGNAEPVNSQLITVSSGPGDTTPPTSTIACNGSACSSGFYTSAVSVTLSATDTGGSGVDSIRYTTDGSDPTTTSGSVYTAAFSLSATTTVKYRAFDNAGNAEAVNTTLIQIDTSTPTLTLTNPVDGATVSGTISMSASPSNNLSVDHIDFLVDGQTVGTDTGAPYTVQWDSTSVADGSHQVVAHSFDPDNNETDSAVATITVSNSPTDTTPPTSTIACNGSACSSGFYTSAVSVTLSATDTGGSGVDSIRYTTDGSDPTATSGSVYTAAFTLSATTTVKYRAFDNAGNAEAVNSKLIQIDTAAPVSTIACNGSACSSGFYTSAVSVTLSATDSGGSGVASIRYTTDGSTPSQSNGSVYGGAFSVTTTTTVKYRAFDNVGNAEPVNSKLIQIDTVAPASTIACNSSACTSGFYTSAVSITLSATDGGGSGVASIRYTTDGTDPSTTNGSVYSSAFSITSTTTIKYRAYDSAGNVEPINSAVIHVDTTAPASTISCNGAACTSGYYRSGVVIALAATDADSGVASIRYTTDGTDPTTTHGTVYTASFSLSATTTVKYRAFDNVGNAETVNTKLIQVDPTVPTVSLTSPANGATLSGTVALAATATDNVAVDHVDFLVDGQIVGTTTTSPYGFSWNSTSVADGTHTIAARAVDTAGNSTTSGSASVTTTNTNLLQNPSLEAATGSTPTCWLLGGYGTNAFTWTRTNDAHTGSFAESLNVSSLTSGDRKLVNAQDSGACAPAVTPGHAYTVTVWYKSTVQPYIFAYYRNSSGWVYWTQVLKPAAATWTQATWTTPVVPAGVTNLSIGIGLNSVGSLTMDDFGLFLTG